MMNSFIITEDDEDLLNFVLDDEPLEELTLTEKEEIFGRITNQVQENVQENRVPEVVPSKEPIDYYVQAFKGDDEITVDLTGLLGSVMIATTQVLLKVEISWSDTCISSDMGNYAEEWILPPLSKNSTYTATTMYSQEESVPWTLDTIKLKMLSPVRKQSSLEDDLESKLQYLGAAAAWCHPDWFTYDFHQMSIILAMECFDFQGATTFPFLNKEDGGLSCPIPWGNPVTLWNYANHFKKGMSITAIGSIIEESNKVKLGLVQPNQTFFLKGINAYKAGSALWKDYISTMHKLQRNNISEIEINDFIKASLEVEIPEDLRQKAIVLDINDSVIAVSISRLRAAGEIITELDLYSMLNEYERCMNLFSEKPFVQLIKEQNEREERVKARPLQTLSSIAEKATICISRAVPDSIDFYSFITSAVDYIDFAKKYQSFRTSFNNTGKVRIYRNADVRQYFDSQNRSELLESFSGEAEPAYKVRRVDVLQDENQKWQDIIKWLTLPDPFQTPIPVGVCTDDARMVHELRGLLNTSQCIIAVTSDHDLSLMLRSLISSHNKINPKEPIDYGNLTVVNYLILSHIHRIRATCLNRYNTMFNYVTSTPVELYDNIIQLFQTEMKREFSSRKGSNWRTRYSMKPIYFIYDTANINRFAPEVTLTNRSARIIRKGFIPAKTISDRTHTQWAISLMSDDQIKKTFLKDQTKEVPLGQYYLRHLLAS